MLRALAILATTHALVAPPSQRRGTAQRAIKVVDHVNMNHEKGRHDLLKAFYFDLLGFAVDPRKIENLDKGKKTLWANAGIAQLHLPAQLRIEEHVHHFRVSASSKIPFRCFADCKSTRRIDLDVPSGPPPPS